MNHGMVNGQQEHPLAHSSALWGLHGRAPVWYRSRSRCDPEPGADPGSGVFPIPILAHGARMLLHPWLEGMAAH